jgi:hypothetical protein
MLRTRWQRVAGLAAAAVALTGLGLAPASRWPLLGEAPTANPDSLYSMVRTLATYPDGSPRTRFAFHPEMDEITAWIENRLEDALLPAGVRGSVERHTFFAMPDTCKTCGHCPTWNPLLPVRLEFKNVIGKLEGRNPGQGKFLITAHYDAIGCRSTGWQAEVDPAPGADDNATGTAAVLELARLLAQDPQYNFDIEFILFDGEEEFLLGSIELAQLYKDRGENILGVLNMDMIGYNPRVDSLVVMSNRSSYYLAEYLVETEARNPQDDFFFTAQIANLAYSDHAPFWDHGYPGILLIENISVVGHNPQYHRVSDVPASLVRQGSMMAKGANTILNALRRLNEEAEGPPCFRLSEGSLLITVNRSPSPPAVAEPGDTVRIVAHAFNLGGELPAEEEQPIRLYRVTDAGRELLAEQVLDGPIVNGGHSQLDFTYRPTAADAGAVIIEAETGSEACRYTARRSFPVRAEAVQLANHYVAPNPIRDLDRAVFAYELTREASVRISVFDLHGDPIGDRSFVLGGDDSGTAAGLNRVPLADVLYEPHLATGIYLYRIEVYAAGASVALDQGKFAVVR